MPVLYAGEKPALETASTPSPSAPDTQLAIYKISNGYSCNDGNDDPDDGCLDGLEFLSLATSSILSSIDSIIDRKKEYLNFLGRRRGRWSKHSVIKFEYWCYNWFFIYRMFQ